MSFLADEEFKKIQTTLHGIKDEDGDTLHLIQYKDGIKEWMSVYEDLGLVQDHQKFILDQHASIDELPMFTLPEIASFCKFDAEPSADSSN